MNKSDFSWAKRKACSQLRIECGSCFVKRARFERSGHGLDDSFSLPRRHIRAGALWHGRFFLRFEDPKEGRGILRYILCSPEARKVSKMEEACFWESPVESPKRVDALLPIAYRPGLPAPHLTRPSQETDAASIDKSQLKRLQDVTFHFSFFAFGDDPIRYIDGDANGNAAVCLPFSKIIGKFSFARTIFTVLLGVVSHMIHDTDYLRKKIAITPAGRFSWNSSFRCVKESWTSIGYTGNR
jgi:hypothetical protein